ncbi:MAG: type II secretion system protein [Methylococcaceae bacterium]|nr:type II secretion system protein [Methylococcaceae bacterium]
MNEWVGQKGFTLIESIMTLVILGILSVTFLPKFFALSSYQQKVLFDDTLAAICYAQKLAVATGCNIQVSIASNTFMLKRPSAIDRSQCASTTAAYFTRDVTNPGTGETQFTGSQSGISLTSTTFYFTALGSVSSGQTIFIGGTRKITVIKETGFVYDSTS